jgi:Protein of unknown function (DUF3500)
MATDVAVMRRAPTAARRMAEAANRFLDSLDSARRETAIFPFAGDERYEWNYTPVPRNGLLLRDMTGEQRTAALALFEAGLSARGAHQAREILALETILEEMEAMENRVSRWGRKPELYYFSIFGQPGGRNPWAWRAGGHHLGLHFTVVDGDLVAPTPLFMGTDPAEVMHGPEKGKRIQAAEEDRARALLRNLDAEQKRVAVVDPVAPADILTRNYRRAERDAAPVGLAYAAMRGEQRGQLVGLIREYVDRVADDLAANTWARIEAEDLDGVTFAWAGPEERWQGHYYAVRGPSFLLEYDNTQNGANHIHAVWRDYDGDWGEDLLARHYAEAHR